MMTKIAERYLEKRKSWIREKLEMEVISPVHIGTREGKISSLEFIFHQGKAHLIDEEKFGKFLKQRNLIDLFVQEAGRGPMILERFLRNTARIEPASVLSQIISQSTPGGEPAMQDFRPFIRDGFGQIFLPGTSLTDPGPLSD